jgi:PqqD family protein of HPr-rel-A system
MLWSFCQTENLLFHGETGETHLLSELTTAVMQQLLEGPRSVTELYAPIAASCGYLDDAKSRRKLDAVLRSLADLELVEQRNPARP